jgi:signal transduction histidine kinase
MKHLHYKLSLATLGIVVLLGAAFYAVDRYSVRLYHEELSQRLNASLAMYVVNAEALVVDGNVNHQALAELANRAMVINPTAEIYLLAPDGGILGHALAPDDVIASRVDMGPVQALLTDSRPLPIKGTDPKTPGSEKIFSAFPVTEDDNPDRVAGYVYVVLGGSQYEAIAEQVAGSDRQRMVGAAFLLMVLTAFVAGALLFSYLTRRLRNLTSDVSHFTETQFREKLSVSPVDVPRDEIDQLRNACHYMAATIQKQLSNIEENDRLRRELVTNISHDLRTPLATMQGYIETLIIKDERLDAITRRQYLDTARKHSVHLGKLIQGLFELAMLDASRVTPVFERFSLTELVQDVVQEFELQAEKCNVNLDIAPLNDAVFVNADINLIQRVLENLVGNALKYTPDGGNVSISIQPSTDSVGIAVSDTGPGIPQEALPHIFDRFYKADSQRADEHGSMGLGLAIAKKIAELHGSEIHVVSEEKQGTRFHFELPFEARAAA